jgi:hypothetical protein
MLGYGVLATCACASRAAPKTATSAKLLIAIVLRNFLCIDLSWYAGFFSCYQQAGVA